MSNASEFVPTGAVPTGAVLAGAVPVVPTPPLPKGFDHRTRIAEFQGGVLAVHPEHRPMVLAWVPLL